MHYVCISVHPCWDPQKFVHSDDIQYGHCTKLDEPEVQAPFELGKYRRTLSVAASHIAQCLRKTSFIVLGLHPSHTPAKTTRIRQLDNSAILASVKLRTCTPALMLAVLISNAN
jgi:hypothetical protein